MPLMTLFGELRAQQVCLLLLLEMTTLSAILDTPLLGDGSYIRGPAWARGPGGGLRAKQQKLNSLPLQRVISTLKVYTIK